MTKHEEMILQVLDHFGAMTRTELITRVQLATFQVDKALATLREAGHITGAADAKGRAVIRLKGHARCNR